MAKTLVGTVKSNKTDKTIVVIVRTRKSHPLYRKQYTASKNFMAHDEKNEAGVGDLVSITETRPISALKHFRLERIIERAPIRHTEAEPVIAAPAAEAPAEKAEAKPAKAKAPAKTAEAKE